jgi:hypothetical protein
MKAIAAALGAMVWVSFVVEPAVAQVPSGNGVEARTQARPHRPRTRVIVRPRYPYRTYHTVYPPPYDIEYPGPNAHRECTGGFATEYRASGAVITPRLNCRWVRY